MRIFVESQIKQGEPQYFRMPHGDRLQDELDYGVDGANTKADTDDDKIMGMSKTQLLIALAVGVVGGILVYRNFIKK